MAKLLTVVERIVVVSAGDLCNDFGMRVHARACAPIGHALSAVGFSGLDAILGF